MQQLGCVDNKYLPDYAQGYALEAVEHRLLGFYRSKDIPYRIELDESIKTAVTCNQDGRVNVAYSTPAGDLKGSFVMDEALKRQGSTLPPIAEHLVKSEADYKPLLETAVGYPGHPGARELPRALRSRGRGGPSRNFWALGRQPDASPAA